MSHQRKAKPQRTQRRTRTRPASGFPPAEDVHVIQPLAQSAPSPVVTFDVTTGGHTPRLGDIIVPDTDLGTAGGGATGPGSAEANFPDANTGGAVLGPGPGGVTAIATQPPKPEQSPRMPRQAKPSPTTRSTSPKTTTGRLPKEGPWRQAKPPRAHRDDTPEARVQRSRAPKSHPGKASAPRNAMRRHKAKG